MRMRERTAMRLRERMAQETKGVSYVLSFQLLLI